VFKNKKKRHRSLFRKGAWSATAPFCSGAWGAHDRKRALWARRGGGRREKRFDDARTFQLGSWGTPPPPRTKNEPRGTARDVPGLRRKIRLEVKVRWMYLVTEDVPRSSRALRKVEAIREEGGRKKSRKGHDEVGGEKVHSGLQGKAVLAPVRPTVRFLGGSRGENIGKKMGSGSLTASRYGVSRTKHFKTENCGGRRKRGKGLEKSKNTRI